jgi:selenide,water dikinase
MARVPLLQGVRDWVAQGMVTGASGRNWGAYGHEVALARSLTPVDQALLTDPQTSGGLLVACAPDAVGEVMAVLSRCGFAQASEIGEMKPRTDSVALRVS